MKRTANSRRTTGDSPRNRGQLPGYGAGCRGSRVTPSLQARAGLFSAYIVPLGLVMAQSAALIVQSLAASAQVDASSTASRANAEPSSPGYPRGEVHLSISCAPVSTLLARVGSQVGANLLADSSLANRRVTVHTVRAPAGELMAAIARVTGATWRLEPRSDQFYWVLYQTKAQALSDRDEVARSLQFAQSLQDLEASTMSASVGQALSANPEGDSATVAILRLVSASQLHELERHSTDRTMAVTANFSELAGFVMFAAPAAELPEPLRRLVTAAVAGQAPAKGPTFGGIAACDNQLRFVWADASTRKIDASTAFGSGPIPDLARDVDFNSEVYAKVRQRQLVRAESMSVSLKQHVALGFPSVDLISFPALLQTVFEQTGATIVADDYVRSRSRRSPILNPTQPYKPMDALNAVCYGFGHTCTYQDGVLTFQTVTRGLDLRAEPPWEVREMLDKVIHDHTAITLADYALLGNLTYVQLRALQMDPVMRGASISGIPIHAYWNAPFLRLYAALSPTERLLAEGPTGLPLVEMKGAAHKMFVALFDRGIPTAVAGPRQPKQPGLYIKRIGIRDKQETVSILAMRSRLPLDSRGFFLRVSGG